MSSTTIRTGTVKRIGGFLDRNLYTIFLIPGLLILCLILVYPIVTNVTLSFTDSFLLSSETHFIGFKNYTSLLADARFWHALGRTIYYTAMALLIQFVLGLACALLLNTRGLKGNDVFRTLVYFPYTLPIIVVTLLWKWILHRIFGVLNAILLYTGIIDDTISWISNLTTVMPTISTVTAWFGFPLITVAILAGLQTIPKEFYEVARIEAASPFQVFRYVIFPSIKRVVEIMLVLRTIWIFNTFDMIYMMTAGGPGDATEVLTIFGYKMGWELYMMGKTSALSVLLMIILAGLITVYFKIFLTDGD